MRFFSCFLLLIASVLQASDNDHPLPAEIKESHGKVRIDGEFVDYRARSGYLILKDEQEKPQASIFFISYEREVVDSSTPRPLIFCTNGGPGSSSIWLHMGLLGPKRVALEGFQAIPPPYGYTENESSLLDVADLVFIDPVSTGFSRAVTLQEEEAFHGVREDIASVADFIRLYITHFRCWDRPLLFLGESYGTLRAVGVAKELMNRHKISLNGIALVSTALDFSTIKFDEGNDLSYLLIFPSYAAAAWYHGKVAGEEPLANHLKRAEEFTKGAYQRALFAGDALAETEREAVIQEMSHLCGVRAEYLRLANLRVPQLAFAKELLRSEKKSIGRFDGRMSGVEGNGINDSISYDVSFDFILAPFTGAFQNYLMKELGYISDRPYQVLNGTSASWDYRIATNCYLNLTEDLTTVLSRAPFTRLFVASGLYDLATPYFATEYTLNHLFIDSTMRERVESHLYPGGHMMYNQDDLRGELKRDLKEFVRKCLYRE